MDSSKDLPNVTHIVVATLQRKARYHDPSRWRLKPLKQAVFKETGIRCSGIIKRCLRCLGVRLDLRLTSAWKAALFELVDKIKAIRPTVDPTQEISSTAKFKKGDRVVWNGYTPLESSICRWFPLQVLKIDGDLAHLEMLYRPVPVAEIEFVA